MPRILLAAIKHESHTFNRFPTTLELFRRQGYLRDAAVPARFRGTGSEMAGFLDVAEARGWEVSTPIAVSAGSGGRVTAEALGEFLSVLEEGLRRAAPLDGVLLALHGAMVAEDEDDPDGLILERVRAIVGPGVPVAATLDPHANLSDRMAAQASILVSYRTNPHVDHRETGQRAAELLARAIGEGARPATVVARAPTLVGFDRARTHTGHGPMIDALAAAAAAERDVPGVWHVSINGGFSHADVHDAGPSVTVSGTAAPAVLHEVAAGLMAEGFRRRAEETVRLASVAEAVAAAREGAPGGPVVIADYTDAPGGGACGDNTTLLRAMIEAGLEDAAFGAIWDPRAAEAARAAGVGARVALRLGGWVDPDFSGTPIEAVGEVRLLSGGDYVHDGPYAPGARGSFGASALVRFGGVDVIVATENRNILDLRQFRIFGIDPARCRTIGLKCMHGFRAAFEPIAGRVLSCDAGGLTTYDYARLPFTRLRRPIWPLENVS
ncbi:M81 family metallopeptidase [Roseomonas sp. BN140053]|uniref:M81 family metallopeptidase n=1 Tax=Roseomonas sp. BN140053 TaxID=3391898 RepID=UPI0039ED4EE2